MAIRFEGEFTVPVSREEAYALLSDPAKFAPLLPTYKSIEVRDERTADVTVQVGVGKVKGSAVVSLTLQGEERPLRAAYSGKGKVIGSAFDLQTSFDLAEVGSGGTNIRWVGDLVMFGKLVALAGGLIRPLAKKDISRLVGAIQAALTPAGAAAATVVEIVEVAPEPGVDLAQAQPEAAPQAEAAGAMPPGVPPAASNSAGNQEQLRSGS